jgi:hypothetical protein
MKKLKSSKKSTENVIRNNVFTGVHWDAQAIESVSMVAQGLLNLSELFKSQNIQIDSMLKINTKSPKTNKKKSKN